MPPEYFEKTSERYPSGDQSALRVFLALRTAARRVDNAVGRWLDPSGLTVTKFDVLHLLAAAAPGGATVGRLRESLRMNLNSFSARIAFHTNREQPRNWRSKADS